MQKFICSKVGKFKFCGKDSEYICSHAIPHGKQPIKTHTKSDCDKYCGCTKNWGTCIPIKEELNEK